MSQKKSIVTVFLFLFLLSGCEKESFIKPYYDKLLGCLEEDHPYIEKASEHNFELSGDAAVFKGAKDPLEAPVVFNRDSNDMCANVKVGESWWNSLPEEYADEKEEHELPRKQDIAKYIFYMCFFNHTTGKTDVEKIDGKDGLAWLQELEKLVNKCGPDVVPLSLQSQLDDGEALLKESTL